MRLFRLVPFTLLVGCLSSKGEPSATATVVQTGNGYTAALTTTGSVRVWGFSQWAGLDSAGTDSRIETPTTIPELATGVVDLNVFSQNGCAAMSDGSVKCWGDNSTYAVGDGTDIDRTAPVTVPGLADVKQVTVGDSFACALSNAGGVKCWGSNADHELGIGDPDEATDAPKNSKTPIDVPGMTSGVKKVVAGYKHVCAVMTSGQLVCWGDNTFGQCGIGNTDQWSLPAYAGDPLAPVAGISGALDVSPGGYWTVAVTGSGAVKSFGQAEDGVLGNGDDTAPDTATPIDVAGLQSGGTATSSLCSVVGGAVWCWGGSDGAGDDDDSTDPYTPVKTLGISDAVQVASGPTSCAVTTSGAIKCWGYDDNGEIGNGESSPSPLRTPVDVISFP